MNQNHYSVVEGFLKNDPVLSDPEREREIICRFQLQTIPRKSEEEPLRFYVKTINRLGEVCDQYLKKGSQVLVGGYLKKVGDENHIEGREVKFFGSRPLIKE